LDLVLEPELELCLKLDSVLELELELEPEPEFFKITSFGKEMSGTRG
jgi:hypothetical protein